MVYTNAAQGETIVLCVAVNKPNPVGKQMLRELILTSHKRLIYVDSATLEHKGTIEWKVAPGAVEPFVKLVRYVQFIVLGMMAMCMNHECAVVFQMAASKNVVYIIEFFLWHFLHELAPCDRLCGC